MSIPRKRTEFDLILLPLVVENCKRGWGSGVKHWPHVGDSSDVQIVRVRIVSLRNDPAANGLLAVTHFRSAEPTHVVGGETFDHEEKMGEMKERKKESAEERTQARDRENIGRTKRGFPPLPAFVPTVEAARFKRGEESETGEGKGERRK